MYAKRTARTFVLVAVLSALLLAGQGAAQGSAPAPRQLTAQTLVQLVGTTFDPTPVEIDAGDSVEWQNSGGLHNVVADDGSFTSGDPSSDWTSFSHLFSAPGIYAYHCAVHGAAGGSGMAGVVVVRDPAATERVYLPLVSL